MPSSFASTKTIPFPSSELRSKPELGGSISYNFQQKSLSVTLDGPTVFTLSVALILLIHYLDSHITELLIGLVPLFLFIHNDYRNFLLLGPGGTPSTFQGYLRVSYLRLWSISDPYRPPILDPKRIPERGILRRQALPYRVGPRPLVAGIAPQRQLDQQGSLECYQTFRQTLERISTRMPDKFGTERSCVEKHGLALFARHPLQTNCQGEICHVHDSDHSMHMCLHPDDITQILQKGWGQRHPLARKSWLSKMPVSPDFVMVYAPRNEQELAIVYKIVEASIWNILAEDVYLNARPKFQ